MLLTTTLAAWRVSADDEFSPLRGFLDSMPKLKPLIWRGNSQIFTRGKRISRPPFTLIPVDTAGQKRHPARRWAESAG